MEIICLLVKFYKYIFMEFYDDYGEDFKSPVFLTNRPDECRLSNLGKKDKRLRSTALTIKIML